MNNGSLPQTLNADDIAAFAKLGIDVALLVEHHVFRVTDEQAREIGIHFDGDLAGILFPYYLDGHRVTARLRRDNPERDSDGRPKNKYISARGDQRHLYVPANYKERLENPATHLLFVEAEKSVLAIEGWSQRMPLGIPILPLGTGGCWGWRGKDGFRPLPNGDHEAAKGPLPEVAWARDGRKCGILFDANAKSNPEVARARKAFREQLEKQGAHVAVFDLPLDDGVNGVDDFIGIAGDAAFLELLSTRPVVQPEPTQTDSGNAELVMENLGGYALYCQVRGEWYLADETKRWSLDRTGRISKLVQEVFEKEFSKLAQHPKDSAQLRHLLKSLNYHGIKNTVAVLEFQQELSIVPERLDADPLYLGVENGILDLVAGELVEPRLDLLVTKCAPVLFDPDAKCERFLEYLNKVQPDEAHQKYLQRLFGSFLTGHQPEQSINFFYGEGGNGKSVFVRVCSDILGDDYCFKARKQLMFLAGRNAAEHGANDIADLDGKRLITTTEQVGAKWNWPFIKDFTGGELQHGRQLYKVGRNFKPVGKLLVSANQKPTLSEFDEAVRRRFVCFPWSVTIPKEERVAPLEMYVQSLLRDGGASGILNWAIQGLRDLILNGWRLEPPPAAVETTEAYIKSEDRIGMFFRDWCEDGPGSLTTKQLRTYYIAYVDEPEKYVLSPKAFTKECQRLYPGRMRMGRSNRYVIDGLQLSEHGKTEYDNRVFSERDA